MQTNYRFVNTDIQDAALNMALDEAILLHHIRGEVPPTLRVFRWSQPSISLGRFQSIEREIESERCQQQRVALVRRPTGGRAVYHRDEFTYSIVIGKREGVPTGVVAAYAYLAQGLLAALKDLGVQAELSDERVSKHPSAACFASSTQADLTSGGFKLVGSAQVWKDESLLQQGSLPLDDRASKTLSCYVIPMQVHERRRWLSIVRKRRRYIRLLLVQAGMMWHWHLKTALVLPCTRHLCREKSVPRSGNWHNNWLRKNTVNWSGAKNASH